MCFDNSLASFWADALEFTNTSICPPVEYESSRTACSLFVFLPSIILGSGHSTLSGPSIRWILTLSPVNVPE